jgi:LysM repeat protein
MPLERTPSRCRPWIGVALALALVVGLPVGAHAAAPHVVQPGETLWWIAASNNLTTRTVAVFNGLPEDAHVLAGETIQVPTVEEGASALAGASATTAADVPATTSSGHIWSPGGDLHLDPAAASAWNSMRQASLERYGIDLYPDGPLGAQRTYAEQQYLWDLFVAGQGAPANPPGSSSHELGLSVDVATSQMRWVIDQIGAEFGWGKVEAPSEWWHVTYVGG